MENRTFYNEILTEHNIRPMHKTKLMEPQKSLRGVNPSCGDDITLQLNVSDDGIITDGAFFGDGCAIGRSVEESLKLKDTFLKMIKDKVTDEELEMLEEAGSLKDISHMPSRVKCAVLGWRTLEEILKEGSETTEVTTE